MRRALFGLLLAWLALPLHASDAGHPVSLWEVSGANNSVFLLGSIHLLRQQDYPLPTALNAAYEEAEVLVMEIDMDDIDPLAISNAFTRYGLIQDDRRLRDLMGTAYWEEAVALADAIDIPLEMLEQTKPWYAAMTVEIMLLNRIGFNPQLGIEMTMLSKARVDNKPVDGLESIEEQIGFLDGMSLEAQREMLISTLAEGATMAGTMDELIDAWRIGDLAVLEADMLAKMAANDEMNQAVVVDRNRRWVSRIEELLNDRDDYLVIVGALHLIGPNGVPEQLRQKGIDVRQLSEPPAVR